MPLYIGVVGSGVEGEAGDLAVEVGMLVAQAGAILVCGGLGGVMAAACRGAKSAGGTTLGILPGEDRSAANRWLDTSVVSGMGHGRNVLVVRTSDVLIALPGGNGTLSEIALALKMNKPVVALGAWLELEGTTPAATAAEAVRIATETPG